MLALIVITVFHRWNKPVTVQQAVKMQIDGDTGNDVITAQRDFTKSRNATRQDAVAGSDTNAGVTDESKPVAETKGSESSRHIAEEIKQGTTTKASESLSVKSQAKTISTITTPRTTSASLESRYYRLRQAKVNPLHYEVLSSEKTLCNSWGGSPFPRILILVISEPSHQDQRAAVRHTWASLRSPYRSLHTKVTFVVGDSGDDNLKEQVRHEHDETHDVLQVDVTDTYQTITAKILAALHWSVQFCSSADYIFKTDDDIFVNIPSLVKTVGSFKKTNVIFGVDIGYAPVRRTGKWALSVEQYPFDHLPLYLSGCGYGMSRDAAEQLVKTSEYVPQLPVEDLYVTGILPRIGNVSFELSHAFPTWLSQTPDDACLVLRGRMVALHGVNVKRMYDLWGQVTNDAYSYCSSA